MKFAWDLVSKISAITTFLRSRYKKADFILKESGVFSFIRPSLKLAFKGIMANCCWLAGSNSSNNFWTENWLGYRILDKIAVDVEVRFRLRAKISEFGINDCWYISKILSSQYPNICNEQDYVLGEEDKLVWKISINGNASCSKIYGSEIHSTGNFHWANHIWANSFILDAPFLSGKYFIIELPRKKKFNSVGFQFASCCHFCYSNSESLDHSFWNCPSAQFLWVDVFAKFRFQASNGERICD